MKCATVSTTNPDGMDALPGLCNRLKQQLNGKNPDLVMVFFTPHHSGEAEHFREGILQALEPDVILGGPGVGVIGESEIESMAGLVLWGACWPDAIIEPFHLEMDEVDGEPSLVGWPTEVSDGATAILLADPYTSPVDQVISGLGERFPKMPVIGGIISGSQGPGEALLLSRDAILDEGCTGIIVGGAVRCDPLVSQGCRPVGHHFVITSAERNVIASLGGKPALQQLTELFQELDPGDKEKIQKGEFHVGRVIDERKSSFQSEDFLVRNVLGQQNGALAISDLVRPGQTVQFMVRDSESASSELTKMVQTHADRGPALGALLFSCNGRGQRFFEIENHDLGVVQNGFPDLPTAGFFAGGEIGPVGGDSFVHGFTASIALFRAQEGN